MLNRAAGPSQSSGQSSHGERRPVRAPRPSQPQHDNELSQEPRDLAEGGIAHGIQATRFLILPAPHVKGPPIKAAMLRATPAHVHEPPQSPSPGPAAARGSLSPTAVPTVRMRVDPGVQPPLSVHTPLKVHTFDASAVSAPDGPDSWQWEPLHGNDPGGGIALLLPASALDGRYIGFGMNGYRLPPEEYGPRTWLAPEPIYEAGPMGRPRPRLVRPPRAAIDAYSGLDCKNPPATVLGIADLVDLICHSDKIVSLRDHGALSNPGTVIRPFGTFTGEFNAEAWRAIEMPEGLQVDLVEHQLVALRWVLDRDSGDGPDRELRGGILADDHGLGKTLVMIAMLLEQARCHPETFNKVRQPVLSHEKWLVPKSSTPCIMLTFDSRR